MLRDLIFIKRSCIVLYLVLQIFIEFATSSDSKAASEALAGRKFDSRVVVTAYYDPDRYYRNEFS